MMSCLRCFGGMSRRCLALLAAAGFACGGSDGNQDRPPATPTGLVAVPSAGRLSLAWDPAVEADVRHVNVLHGYTPNALVQLAEVAAPLTTWEVEGLDRARTYHFALQAEDGAGHVSETTAAIAAEIPPYPEDVVVVDCTIPFVLDGASKDTDYVTSHQIPGPCVTGTMRGVDVSTVLPVVHFGAHGPASLGTPSIILRQNHGTLGAVARSFEFDFYPDSAVTTGSRWEDWGLHGPAIGGAIQWFSETEWCLLSIAVSGSMTFSAAERCTDAEGGRFSVQGTARLVDPYTVPNACRDYRCCP